jgi:hypothetical protein
VKETSLCCLRLREESGSQTPCHSATPNEDQNSDEPMFKPPAYGDLFLRPEVRHLPNCLLKVHTGNSQRNEKRQRVEGQGKTVTAL